jgi:hypothetical protein
LGEKKDERQIHSFKEPSNCAQFIIEDDKLGLLLGQFPIFGTKKKNLPLTKKTRQGAKNTKSQIISTKD